MPSILNPAGGDIVTVRIEKTMVSNPAISWVNNYKLLGDAAGGPSNENLRAAADALLNFERAIHVPAVQFRQYTISTIAEDSDPYDPFTFVTVPLEEGLVGQRSIASDLEPLQMCLYVKKVVTVGRQGKQLYRGVLQESDVSAAAGAPRLSSPITMSTLVAGAIADSGLGSFLSADPDSAWYLVMTNKTGGQIRPVSDLQAAGVSIAKMNHRYFDRA